MDPRPLIRVAIAGSVDDGKSTLLGRLLFDTQSILDDQLASLERASLRSGEAEMNLALLTDGLRAEREQKITIDVAYRHFATPNRRILLADTPGHEQYTRNMVTGASTADAAILLVDASRGITSQTLRHAAIVAMLHVPRLLIAVNKMDLVHFEESTFNSICEDMQRKVASLALPKVDFVPVAARTGANVVRADESLSWFKGPTVLEFLESIEPRRQTGSLVRFPVQLAFRPDGTFRGFAGSLSAGRLSLGDEVHASRADRTSRVVGILGPDGPRDHCEAGEPVVLELADAIDGGRGELFVAPESRAHRTFRFTTNLCVMSPQGLRPGSRVLLRHLTREEPAEVDRILSRFDTEGLTPRETSRLELNDLGIASLRVATPIFADLFQDCPATGAVVLLAADTFEVVAAGTILSIENSGPESPPAGHGRVVWLTGLSGAGKTTLAEGLREDLRALGVASVILDGDALRAGVNRDLGFSEEARTENVRRTAEIARLLAEQGVWVLCSLISPLRSQRHFARELLAPYFIEVYVRCSLETATKRDPKGLYRRAYAGEIRSFTGISSPYEAPEAPDVLIDTEAESVTAARTRLLDAMRVRLLG